MFDPAEPLPAITAAGHGRAVLLAVTGGLNHYALVVQTRRNGRFGSPYMLARRSRELSLGPAVIGLGGGVTAAWPTCAVGRALHVHGCPRLAQRWPWRTRTFPDGGQAGDGYVLLSRCAGQACRLSVSYADRQGCFGNPQTITHDGQFVTRDEESEASSGRRRVRVVVWVSSHGGAFAAVANPGHRRFGSPHRLAGDGSVSYGLPVYEAGPRDQVIVGWQNRDGTISATVYTP